MRTLCPSFETTVSTISLSYYRLVKFCLHISFLNVDVIYFWLRAGKEMGFTGHKLDRYITSKLAIRIKRTGKTSSRRENTSYS